MNRLLFINRAVPAHIKRNIKQHLGVPSIERTLSIMQRNGFSPEVAIDVGAYRGDWTTMFRRHFPNAQVLMVEPQHRMRTQLEAVAAKYPRVALATALLGADVKPSVMFHHVDTASSVLPEHETAAASSEQLPMTTLDTITAGTPFAHPDFIKLDVQGYELEVLRGGAEAMRNAEAVLLEVSLLEVNQGAPLFAEVIAFMAEHGFRVYDVCTFFRRPYDSALWQVDVMFVRNDSRLVESRRWA